MANIEKRHIIDSKNLSGEFYFTSVLQEAYACGLLSDFEIETIQLQCLELLAYKSERYYGGESSSIRAEAAESIMKSNFYTMGLHLKSLPDAEWAVNELKTASIPEVYQKGRNLINAKLQTAKHIYKSVQKNKISTLNYTYNATLANGLGSFFQSYNPDYEAHEVPASIDYQLCNPVTDLAGVEFIQQYLLNLYLENQFCSNFAAENIHHLLSGYHEGYKDLLINIFEQVLTAAMGCVLAGRSVVQLDIAADEIQYLHNKLSQENVHSLAMVLYTAAEQVLDELKVTNLTLHRYIEKSLPQIIANIDQALKTDTLNKVFVSPINPDLKPKIIFFSSIKMNDEEYRKLIDELLVCRYSSDKIALVKEKVNSFADLEDVLFDAQLSVEEIISVFSLLGDVEIAALIRRHPFISDIQAVDLSAAEQALRLHLKSYVAQLPAARREQIDKIVVHFVEE